MNNLEWPTLYLIDDDIISQFTTRVKVKQSGFPCHLQCFESPFSVLDNFLSENANFTYPDVILLDLNMPTMDGWEFIELLRTTNNPNQFPFIYIVSSFESVLDFDKANRHPMVRGYFTKPISVNNILSVMGELEMNKRVSKN